MILRKEDVGRKAILRNGDVVAIQGWAAGVSTRLPVYAGGLWYQRNGTKGRRRLDPALDIVALVTPLTLCELREGNETRAKEWNPDGPPLSLSFAGNELAGEVGEACNEIKKLERANLGMPGGKTDIGPLTEELADVIICVDLVAKKLGIDLSEAVRNKFNKTSKKHGFETKL